MYIPVDSRRRRCRIFQFPSRVFTTGQHCLMLIFLDQRQSDAKPSAYNSNDTEFVPNDPTLSTTSLSVCHCDGVRGVNMEPLLSVPAWKWLKLIFINILNYCAVVKWVIVSCVDITKCLACCQTFGPECICRKCVGNIVLIITYLLSCTVSKIWQIIGPVFAHDRGGTSLMPGFQHYVSVVPEPFCRHAVLKFRCYQKIRKKIPFRSRRQWQKSAVSVRPLLRGESLNSWLQNLSSRN